ncbi:hypothetical protein A2973_03445 [Candidatus Gottesmanbacteria bacterium RIFCSPLOWO2_01_FULL_49_10]|uniref:Peptidase M20 dimerisation domain-containing protein n=1 Tax=Candidatus Gottesmanbacteria bacterium RIFCSPLOWO2_01_FULL_49_10 TaxID=1798396 RepID=A0A1F6AVL7_9BACT|nr:MAG: Aminoacyl-histidine dipeptidase [Microgenomates group bacterium GW2011_GWA2_47_8]OGG28755.1 MAG: hypothetical protein A2973_03445 [Candidatus Gottesmanbacteria bacterium RIFCSPLOWO2_01_FULL_49_10]
MTTRSELNVVEMLESTELEPGLERLWGHFADIAKIPRDSGHENEIASHIILFAQERELSHEVDEYGNILIEIPGTKGHESTPGIVLQAHLDMVCLGKPDPGIHGVRPRIDGSGEWMTADTTLGADNGIGVAAILALIDESIPHGPLAFILTRTEETGLVGARRMAFANKLDTYKYLVNLDSEDEGELTISSAGAGDTALLLPVVLEPISDKKIVSIQLRNLMGGHSGVVIGEGRLNGIKVMTSVLRDLLDKQGIGSLISINSGEKRNAIPSSAEALLALKPQDIETLRSAVLDIRENLRGQALHPQEKALELTISDVHPTGDHQAMTRESATHMLSLLSSLPDGLMKWSEDVPGLPQTSTNLAIVKTADQGVEIEMMSRSSVFDELEALREKIAAVATSHGASVEQSEAYSGWPADPKNPLIRITSDEWKTLTGCEIKIVTTHGGLECGVITGKYPELRAISIGPTIKKAHEEGEMVHIASVTRFYSLVKQIVSRMGSPS